MDSTGQLYVASGTNILVFAAGANGNVAPTRTLGVASTLITQPDSLATDASNNLYVANWRDASNVEFSSTATGNVAPTKTLVGGSTALANVFGVAVDASGDIYATSTSGLGLGSILEFSPTATGGTAPMRTIQGSGTNLNSTAGVRVDSAGVVYAVSTNAGGFPSILAFSPTASGNTNAASSFSSNALWTLSISGQFAIK